METAMGDAGARQTRKHVAQLSAAAHSKFGDRVVRMAEEILGEPLDARLQAVHVVLNEAGYDPFGFDPKVARYVMAVAALLHRKYFRTQVYGIESVPYGRALFVSNHSGQIPLDGGAIVMALLLDKTPPIFPRSMVERWSAELPFVSWLFPRCGQVLGSPENARRLLEQDQPLIVFPEGARGVSKPFSQRYQLQHFGSGFLRLALECKAPVVPVAVIGAEEQLPSVGNLPAIAKRLGMPALPVIPQLALGLWLPLPVRYRLYFGEPMHFSGDADDDESSIDAQVMQVRDRIRALLEQGLAARESVFW